jgi:hypothetical protein
MDSIETHAPGKPARGKGFWLRCCEREPRDKQRARPGSARLSGPLQHQSSLANRGRNPVALMEIFDEIFKTRTIEELGPIFNRKDVWYTPPTKAVPSYQQCSSTYRGEPSSEKRWMTVALPFTV